MKILKLTLFSTLLLANTAKASDFMDYLSGCMMGMGSGLVGTALADTKAPAGQKMETSGFAIAGGLGCLAGVAYVGIVGSSAHFEATYDLNQQNKFLTYERLRLARERCILEDECHDSKAVIIPSGTELKKMGDKVYETQTYTIEPLK